MPPQVDYSLCTGCGICLDVCAEDVFGEGGERRGEVDGGPIVVHPEVCFHCNLCVNECPVGALKLRIPLVMMIGFKE